MANILLLDGADTLLTVKVYVSVAALLLFVSLRWMVRRIISNYAIKNGFSESRISAAHRAVSVIGTLLLVSVLAITWSINSDSFLVVSGAILAAIGIGFFADWSILSNVTTSIIMFWRFPMRVGDRIGLLDDKSFIAEVKEFTVFFIILEDLDGNRISLPNTLTLKQMFIIYRRDNDKKKKPASSKAGSQKALERVEFTPRSYVATRVSRRRLP